MDLQYRVDRVLELDAPSRRMSTTLCRVATMQTRFHLLKLTNSATSFDDPTTKTRRSARQSLAYQVGEGTRAMLRTF